MLTKFANWKHSKNRELFILVLTKFTSWKHTVKAHGQTMATRNHGNHIPAGQMHNTKHTMSQKQGVSFPK